MGVWLHLISGCATKKTWYQFYDTGGYQTLVYNLDKFSLRHELPGFLRMLLFFQRITTRIHFYSLRVLQVSIINNHIVSEFSFPLSLHGYEGIEMLTCSLDFLRIHQKMFFHKCGHCLRNIK